MVQGVLQLQQVLEAGGFAVTAEVMPPRGGDLAATLAVARPLRGLVHACRPCSVQLLKSLNFSNVSNSVGHGQRTRSFSPQEAHLHHWQRSDRCVA